MPPRPWTTAAAISIAVYHTAGKWVRQLPIRIENLLQRAAAAGPKLPAGASIGTVFGRPVLPGEWYFRPLCKRFFPAADQNFLSKHGGRLEPISYWCA